MSSAILINDLGKSYRLGVTHAGSLRDLMNGAIGSVFRRPARDHRPAPLVSQSRIDAEGKFWALRDVTFAVEPGEVVGVIGKNGAGKSTLLKILSRITPPTAGRVELHGRVASLLEVGTGFHPELTGRENVFLNGTILGMTRREVSRKLDEIVAFAEVEQFLDTPVKRYSSGMYVRLAFAVAAHLDPEILIVDEVLAVGDAAFQQKCLGKMSALGHSGRTILFVSHNMPAIRQLTSRCVIISDGRLDYCGPSRQAVDRYLDQQRIRARTTSDVSNLPRAGWCGDRSVEFTEAELVSPAGGKLGAEEDLTIRVMVRAREEVRSCWFGVTISTGEGTPVASAFADPVGAIGAGESAEFQLTILCPGLAPGEYWVTLGIVRGAKLIVDVIHEALHFEAPAEGRVPPGFVEWESAWGHLRLNVTSAPTKPSRQAAFAAVQRAAVSSSSGS